MLPQIDAKRALRRERRAARALSGRQTSASEVFWRTVSDHGHIMAVVKQPEPESQPRLAGANDQKPSQCHAPLCTCGYRLSETGSTWQLAWAFIGPPSVACICLAPIEQRRAALIHKGVHPTFDLPSRISDRLGCPSARAGDTSARERAATGTTSPAPRPGERLRWRSGGDWGRRRGAKSLGADP